MGRLFLENDIRETNRGALSRRPYRNMMVDPVKKISLFHLYLQGCFFVGKEVDARAESLRLERGRDVVARVDVDIP